MAEIVSPAIVLALAGALAGASVRAFSRPERTLLVLAFVCHGCAAYAQVWITRGYYGSGDMTKYFSAGSIIADVVRYRPTQFLPELWHLLIQVESRWPFQPFGAGTSTGTMTAISALLQLVLGQSIYALCLALSFAAFFGQLALCRAFREHFPPSLHGRLAVATMLVPSAVFWSSGILKETVAMAALGWIVLGMHRFAQRRRLLGATLIVSAGFWVALVKPYILFALVLSAGIWWYWRRSLDATGGRSVAVRPVYLLAGAGTVLGLMVGLGELFPRYALENIGDEAARLQEVGAQVDGGSYYEVAAAPQRSLLGQLAFAPFALLTALFRPVIMEVRNVTMAVNALETTVLTGLLLRTALQRTWSAVWLQLTRSPPLVFASVFVAAFGIAVGLASTNLGTLSRYRTPLIPLFAVIVLVLTAPQTREAVARVVPGDVQRRVRR